MNKYLISSLFIVGILSMVGCSNQEKITKVLNITETAETANEDIIKLKDTNEVVKAEMHNAEKHNPMVIGKITNITDSEITINIANQPKDRPTTLPSFPDEQEKERPNKIEPEFTGETKTFKYDNSALREKIRLGKDDIVMIQVDGDTAKEIRLFTNDNDNKPKRPVGEPPLKNSKSKNVNGFEYTNEQLSD